MNETGILAGSPRCRRDTRTTDVLLLPASVTEQYGILRDQFSGRSRQSSSSSSRSVHASDGDDSDDDDGGGTGSSEVGGAVVEAKKRKSGQPGKKLVSAREKRERQS